ncbi:MAG TPA: saccharopine dehydrogenase NADP-binding domain-containing protein [Solirubrobacteraceae bacterium]|nr:saccharopine dehydrogenase NADP-binding domain-containing protein [Solirubrobacteraceae bacterium]
MNASDDNPMHIAVLGAGGTIAPPIVRDLAASPEVASMNLLDIDAERAAAVAAANGAGKASAQAVDATDVGALADALADADVLVNSASYRVNLEAMRACLRAGCHYLDLGGLYWMTQRQLELGPEFERAGLLAVLGIGSSPGKTNLMARAAVAMLGAPDTVDSIDVAAAGRDPEAAGDERPRPPYAIQTLLDELTLEPVVLRGFEAVQIAPLSPGGVVDYGDPIGSAETIYTLHSELATFGPSFGCANASFRLSLSAPLLERLVELTSASPAEVTQAGRDAAPQSNRTVSVHLVVVGAGGRTITARAVTRPHNGVGGSVNSTAAPAAAAVRLLARGSLEARGAHPPERCIEPEEMFAELRARGCSFSFEG